MLNIISVQGYQGKVLVKVCLFYMCWMIDIVCSVVQHTQTRNVDMKAHIIKIMSAHLLQHQSVSTSGNVYLSQQMITDYISVAFPAHWFLHSVHKVHDNITSMLH